MCSCNISRQCRAIADLFEHLQRSLPGDVYDFLLHQSAYDYSVSEVIDPASLPKNIKPTTSSLIYKAQHDFVASSFRQSPPPSYEGHGR